MNSLGNTLPGGVSLFRSGALFGARQGFNAYPLEQSAPTQP